MRKLLRSPVVKVVARWANKEPFIWDGVYESFDQVPVVGRGFMSDAWLADMERYTRTAVAALRRGEVGVPENVPPYHALLAMLIASVPVVDRPVRVLDFGGGMGIGLANVRRCMAAGTELEYLIVDNEESCERGRRLLEEFSSVKFMSELPRDVESVDVIVLSSVLQFVEEYEKLLNDLAAFRPAHWLFTFLPAGDIPTFASAQLNVPGSVLPVWFFNVDELTEIVEKFGYQLVFKSTLDRVFDMSNFPLTHQLPRQCNLLFRRQ
ncbi:MAG TPA: methyltransferase, TIGR04325 family [Pyrinomonadaceae bacterium]|nr:methyltransferase, TIGR04325 family [Pyrinomonadaceae bacterium]